MRVVPPPPPGRPADPLAELERLRRTPGPWLHLLDGAPSDARQLGWMLGRDGVVVRVLRGHCLRTTYGLYDETAAALQLPGDPVADWAGLAALLTDMGWLPGTGHALVVTRSALLLAAAPLAELHGFIAAVRDVARGRAEEGEPLPFHVVLQDDTVGLAALRARLDAVGARYDELSGWDAEEPTSVSTSSRRSGYAPGEPTPDDVDRAVIAVLSARDDVVEVRRCWEQFLGPAVAPVRVYAPVLSIPDADAAEIAALTATAVARLGASCTVLPLASGEPHRDERQAAVATSSTAIWPLRLPATGQATEPASDVAPRMQAAGDAPPTAMPRLAAETGAAAVPVSAVAHPDSPLPGAAAAPAAAAAPPARQGSRPPGVAAAPAAAGPVPAPPAPHPESRPADSGHPADAATAVPPAAAVSAPPVAGAGSPPSGAVVVAAAAGAVPAPRAAHAEPQRADSAHPRAAAAATPTRPQSGPAESGLSASPTTAPAVPAPGAGDAPGDDPDAEFELVAANLEWTFDRGAEARDRVDEALVGEVARSPRVVAVFRTWVRDPAGGWVRVIMEYVDSGAMADIEAERGRLVDCLQRAGARRCCVEIVGVADVGDVHRWLEQRCVPLVPADRAASAPAPTPPADATFEPGPEDLGDATGRLVDWASVTPGVLGVVTAFTEVDRRRLPVVGIVVEGDADADAVRAQVGSVLGADHGYLIEPFAPSAGLTPTQLRLYRGSSRLWTRRVDRPATPARTLDTTYRAHVTTVDSVLEPMAPLADEQLPGGFTIVGIDLTMPIETGPEEPDDVDAAVTEWARGQDHVLALLRAVTNRQGQQSVPVYSVVVRADTDRAAVRHGVAQVVAGTSTDRAGVEVFCPFEKLSLLHVELFRGSVTLWRP
jgi:hypothetical protein